MEKKQPDLKPLEAIDMHAPIEVRIKIYASPDGKTVSVMEAIMPAGRYPSIEQMRLMVDTALTPEHVAAGGRLLLKPEFIAHLSKRETGTPMAMAGEQHFVAPPCEIPHKMLVHAVAGTEFEYGSALANEYAGFGLLRIESSGHGGIDAHYNWDRAALAKLPADVLLALYKRITT